MGSEFRAAWDDLQRWLILNVGSRDGEDCSVIVSRIIDATRKEQQAALLEIREGARTQACRITGTFCDEGGPWHSYEPNGDQWCCKTCSKLADRDPALPCTHHLFGQHNWGGHDAKGLLCRAGAPWDAAKVHYCACGAIKPAHTG